MASPVYLYESPLRLEPDAGLDEGTSSLELGQPGQATTTIRILRDLVHNAKANGLTWEHVRLEIRAKKEAKKADESKKSSSVGGDQSPVPSLSFLSFRGPRPLDTRLQRHPPSPLCLEALSSIRSCLS